MTFDKIPELIIVDGDKNYFSKGNYVLYASKGGSLLESGAWLSKKKARHISMRLSIIHANFHNQNERASLRTVLEEMIEESDAPFNAIKRFPETPAYVYLEGSEFNEIIRSLTGSGNYKTSVDDRAGTSNTISNEAMVKKITANQLDNLMAPSEPDKRHREYNDNNVAFGHAVKRFSDFVSGTHLYDRPSFESVFGMVWSCSDACPQPMCVKDCDTGSPGNLPYVPDIPKDPCLGYAKDLLLRLKELVTDSGTTPELSNIYYVGQDTDCKSTWVDAKSLKDLDVEPDPTGFLISKAEIQTEDVVVLWQYSLVSCTVKPIKTTSCPATDMPWLYTYNREKILQDIKSLGKQLDFEDVYYCPGSQQSTFLSFTSNKVFIRTAVKWEKEFPNIRAKGFCIFLFGEGEKENMLYAFSFSDGVYVNLTKHSFSEQEKDFLGSLFLDKDEM